PVVNTDPGGWNRRARRSKIASTPEPVEREPWSHPCTRSSFARPRRSDRRASASRSIDRSPNSRGPARTTGPWRSRASPGPRPRAGPQEACRVVVGPLPRGRLGRIGRAPLRVAGRIAEPIQDDDRVRRESQVVGDVVLAVVGVARAPVVRVQPEAVLRVRTESAIRARIAVAVAEVDEEVRALRDASDVGPRGVGAVALVDG